MTILSAAEAASVLRCEESDVEMIALLPQVDAYVKNATGRDWAVDNPVYAEAKSAARMLLVQWHENPGMASGEGNNLSFGLRSVLVQLEVKAMQLAAEEAEAEE